MILITAAPPVVDPPPTDPPPPPPPELHSLSVRWTSWTGREWELSDWTSPLFLTPGVQGFGPADVEHWWDDSPSIDGSNWQGSRVGRGSVFLPIFLSANTSAEFLLEHRRFLQSLTPREEGILRVTQPDGTWREQTCRYESGLNVALALDPVMQGNVSYGITWATPDPYWSGEPVTWSAGYASAADFFPGPPWTLAPSQVLGDPDATVDNQGDVDAYPLWRIDGPFSGFTVGVGSSLVTSTLSLTAGHWVEIDMRPSKLTVLDEAGNDRWPTLTDAQFSSIPPGTSGITTTVNGASAGAGVTLSFRPLYEGAF